MKNQKINLPYTDKAEPEFGKITQIRHVDHEDGNKCYIITIGNMIASPYAFHDLMTAQEWLDINESFVAIIATISVTNNKKEE